MQQRAFTLIELLVVIAIIGILSSVVLASLNTARTKARVSSIEAQTLQLRTLFELEYADTGSYAALNKGWVSSAAACTSRGYTGNYASNAVSICQSLANLVTNPTANGFMHTGVNTGTGHSNSGEYAIMVRLPDGNFFCAGSSGGTSDNTSNYSGAGCYSNP